MRFGQAIALAFCLVAAGVAQVDVEDPQDMAEEMLSQLSFDELDNQQSRGELYASELKGLNQVEAHETDHIDLGESDSTHQSAADAAAVECGNDDECRTAVHDIVLGAAQNRRSRRSRLSSKKKAAKDEEAECHDSIPAICAEKKSLCEHGEHGKHVSGECPRTCGVCGLLKTHTTCRDLTTACSVPGRKRYCHHGTVKNICKKMCASCSGSESPL
eukprot:TRINITY_DN299_c0_g1_i2.p1 TRINITY_DN299_c0_g1~~TRINITY_DN299_c0_g1_i2.p1  ORF type:complete len:216 (+),score=45.64 TRINITY_DN299_c0_g1_i2:185-832(+)